MGGFHSCVGEDSSGDMVSQPKDLYLWQ